MVRKLAILVLSLATVGFVILTIQRMSLNYNENGVYFDGVATYSRDAIVSYGTISGILLCITVCFIFYKPLRNLPASSIKKK